MRCTANCWLTSGAVLAGLAVVAGAFAAHGLGEFVANKYAAEPPRLVAGQQVAASLARLDDFQTAARYQMDHALGLIAVGLLARARSNRRLQLAGWSFVLGIVLFSGSLYALTLSGQRWFGAIAPVGGTLLIVGWFALAAAVCPCGESDRPSGAISEAS